MRGIFNGLPRFKISYLRFKIWNLSLAKREKMGKEGKGFRPGPRSKGGNGFGRDGAGWLNL
jgi:hypothetical protein